MRLVFSRFFHFFSSFINCIKNVRTKLRLHFGNDRTNTIDRYMAPERTGVSPTLLRAPSGESFLRPKIDTDPRSIGEVYEAHVNYYQFTKNLQFTLRDGLNYGSGVLSTILTLSGPQLDQPIWFGFHRGHERNGDGRSHPLFRFTFDWDRPEGEKDVPYFHTLEVVTHDFAWNREGEVVYSEAGGRIIKSFSLRDEVTGFPPPPDRDIPKYFPHQDALTRYHAVHGMTTDASFESQVFVARDLAEMVR